MARLRFDMQKVVVITYALIKIMISIAPRSLTVTDPQPNKAHFDINQSKT
jgi:hypothetical protein